MTFLLTAKKILNDFHNNQSSASADVEKLRAIIAAAELIKNDIKILSLLASYPTVEGLGSLEGSF